MLPPRQAYCSAEVTARHVRELVGRLGLLGKAAHTAPTADYAPSMAPVVRESHDRLRVVGICLFVVGIAAVVALLVTYVLGYTDLPWWLNTLAAGSTGIGAGLWRYASIDRALVRYR